MAKGDKEEGLPPELGDRVKDRISGFTGIVTAQCIFLNGCVRLAITPEEVNKDGDVHDGKFFDIQDVLVVKRGIHKPVIMKTVEPSASPPAGPRTYR